MLRWCGVKLLFAALLPLQAGLFVVVLIVTQDWSYSAANLRRSPLVTNDTPAVRSFLAEYEKYCRVQLTPAPASDVPASQLCPCIPGTLGKCFVVITACCTSFIAHDVSVGCSLPAADLLQNFVDDRIIYA